MLENRRHENFAKGIAIEGLSATEAYRKYVSGGNCADNTAAVNACNMLKDGTNVSLRIAEMRKELEAKERISRYDLQAWYEDIILAPPNVASEDSPICETVMTKCGPFTSLVSKKEAAAALARMKGWNEPEKVEVTHSGTIEHTHSFDGVLKSIIDSGSPVTRRLEKAREREVEVIPLEPAKKKK